MAMGSRAFHSAGKFLRRHAKTIGAIALGAAAVATAVHHGRAREASSEQRHRDNEGNMAWYTSQPEVREAMERRRRETEGEPGEMARLMAGARSIPLAELRRPAPWHQ